MRNACAMRDASTFFCFSNNPCEPKCYKQSARCCLPNNIRPSPSAHKTARIAQPCPAQRETPLCHLRHYTDAYDQKKPVRKPLRRNRGGRPRRAGVRLRCSARPAPPCVSAHSCHKGSRTSSTSELAASQSASALRSSWTSWCQTLDATTSSLACTQTL